MALRWCAAEVGEAAKQYRPVNDLLRLPALRLALEAHVEEAVIRRSKPPEHHVAVNETPRDSGDPLVPADGGLSGDAGTVRGQVIGGWNKG